MAQERVLLEEDTELLTSILSDLSQYQNPFEKVVDTYEALNLGEMNEEVFAQIKNGQTGQIVRQYNQKLEQELDKAKISNPTLRANMLAGSKEQPKVFLNAVNEFANTEIRFFSYMRRELGSSVQLTIDDISFKDGELYISEEGKEAISEKHCRFYIETEEEMVAYEAATIISEQYKRLMDIDKKFQMNLNRAYLNSISDFFIDVGENIKPNNRFISGLSAMMKRMAKYR